MNLMFLLLVVGALWFGPVFWRVVLRKLGGEEQDADVQSG